MFPRRLVFGIALIAILLLVVPAFAQDDTAPPAPIINDEGGPVLVTGVMTYTNPEFTAGAAQPLIIMEDQAGFVDRNQGFLMSPQSQTLGAFTSDFYTSPVTYEIALPQVPRGEYRDVDFDGVTEEGVQIFTPAYWTNTFGGPYLEERDLYGGGWSSAYAGTRVDQNDPDAEVIGGTYVVYAPDDAQSFPSNFGPDGRLFTGDEDMVTLPAGYTVVNLDTDPFTFSRPRVAVIDLIEGEEAQLDDFSNLSYTEAFDAMIALYREEYAFTEYKGLDWDAIAAEFRPRFEEAEANRDRAAYLFALRDFTWAIPDGHIFMTPGDPVLDEDFFTQTQGGLGMAIRDVDDGRTIVNFILPGGPAEQAGIQLGAEILSINGVPIDEVVDNTVPYSSPFSTEWNRRLQQLRYAIRFPLGAEVELEFQNPGDRRPTAVTLQTVDERASFRFSSFSSGLTGLELPVEYELLDNGLLLVRIYSFFDNEVLTVQLWERVISLANDNGLPGIILDVRQNGGGNGFLAEQMAAYFFQEPLTFGFDETYNRNVGDFVINEERPARFYLPPENLRYDGPVAVLVGPSCASACEVFADAMTVQDRAVIVGQYPTAGLGGARRLFAMPENQFVSITITRNLNENREINIEGIGVQPTVRVPVTEETLFYNGDIVLDTAIQYLSEQLGLNSGGELIVTDGGEITVGQTVEGTIQAGERIRYTLTADADVVVNISLGESTGQFDTYLRVYGAGDELIAENDDRISGSNFNSLIEGLTLASGDTVVIEVGTYADGSSGDYTLSVEAQK
ncbi:MAG: S41 family peptidase [Candidatus Flexifilum sp.]|jgi:C-terminal processing protease CtpA/Prc